MGCLGLPGWFGFNLAYLARVRLRPKLAAGLGEAWTRDGCIPQGCPASVIFVVALYVPWCRCLAEQPGVTTLSAQARTVEPHFRWHGSPTVTFGRLDTSPRLVSAFCFAYLKPPVSG